jgi:hypothetical protein
MKLAGAVWCAIALSMIWSQASREQGPSEKSTQELLELEDHWLQVENDPEALESIIADDFLHVVPVGIITKYEQLNFMRKHPSHQQSSRHFEDLHVRIYGSVGIVNGAVVATNGQGAQKTLFTDVFAHREGKWRAVNAQELSAARATR